FNIHILGFLCLEDTSLGVTGNNSLRDMIMALKWVQGNIQSFMGDPQNVTLFGESSGAVSIHYLMLSPLAKGLFHKIILQSSCALNHWALGARDSAPKIASSLGLSSNDDREILEFLQQQPVRLLFDAQEKIKVPISPHLKRHFYPVLEKTSPFTPAVIGENPVDVIKSGNYNRMPMMIGYTSNEGLFFEYKINKILKSNATNSLLVRNFEHLVPHDLNISIGTALSQYIGNEIKSFYFNGDEPTLKYRLAYYQVH
ncbi:esterase, partial [Oryctes borbonicus]